jgi:hydroxymethylpyrimidine/phosphomethylpyrimidine kinase
MTMGVFMTSAVTALTAQNTQGWCQCTPPPWTTSSNRYTPCCQVRRKGGWRQAGACTTVVVHLWLRSMKSIAAQPRRP